MPYTPPSSHGVMHLLPCESDQALVISSFGIPEPTPETCPLYEEGREWVPDLIIVPGTAFDRAGGNISHAGSMKDAIAIAITMANRRFPKD